MVCVRSSFKLGGPKLPVLACVAAVLVVAIPISGSQDEPEPILRIEQDWKLVLNEPDQAVHAPQFHTVMSPVGDLDSLYAQVTWNWRELPDFAPGGLQIQGWADDECRLHRDFSSNELSTTAETLRWTQTMETNGAVLTFAIINGQSATWGAFGGHSLQIQGTAPIASLNNYDTNVSAANSVITYGSNRVDSLVITEVRYYGADGLLGTDSVPKVVYQGEQADQGGGDTPYSRLFNPLS
ncbi:MAG: hypothetical protein JSU68_07795 [Phycisphaerales bacterium]|nr:MAG: hypothetical protein JSU68_07795 [Phycisphaerales bacterium]